MAVTDRELRVILSAQDRMSGVLKRASGSTGSAFSKLADVAKTTAGVLIGTLGARAVGSIVRGLKSIAGEAFEAVAGHERLGLSLEALVGRELRNESAVEKVIGTTRTRLKLDAEERAELDELRISHRHLGTDIQVAAERLAQATAKGKESTAQIQNRRDAVEKLQRRQAEYASDITALEAKEGSFITTQQTATEYTLSQADAMAQAQDRAKELIGWIEKVGVKSPFSAEDIGLAFKQALAFGFNTKEAQRMTLAVGDYTAATGASGEMQRRINLNLGQMHRQERVLQRDMRDLAVAGVNAYEYIARAMGITTKEVQELISKGMVPYELAIDAIVKGMEEDFGGAMERQATSLSGLKESLQEMRKISLRNVFTGIFRAIQPYMARMLDKVSSPAFQAALARIGDTLGRGVGRFLEWAPRKFGELRRTAGDAFLTMAGGLKFLPGPLRDVLALIGGWIKKGGDLPSLVRNLKGSLSEFTDWLKGTPGRVKAAWGEIVAAFREEGIVGAAEKALSLVGVEVDFGEIWQKVTDAWGTVKNVFEEKGLVAAVERALRFAGVKVDLTGLGEKFRAAWKDLWLGKLVGEEVGAIGGVMRAGGLKEKVVAWLDVIPEAILGLGPKLGKAWTDLWKGKLTWVDASRQMRVGGLEEKVTDWLDDIPKAILGLGPKLGQAWADLWEGQSVGEEIGPLGAFMRSGGLKGKLETMLRDAGTALVGLSEGLLAFAGTPDFQTKLYEISTKVSEAIMGALKALFGSEETGNELITALRNNLLLAVSNMIVSLADIGTAIAFGIIQGIVNTFASEETAKEIASAIKAVMAGEAVEAPPGREWIVEQARRRRMGLRGTAMPQEEAVEMLRRRRAGLRAYQSGTSFAPGGWAMVGERGPELLRLPRGSQVLSNAQTQQAAGATNHWSIVQHFHGRADPAQVLVATRQGVLEAARAKGLA